MSDGSAREVAKPPSRRTKVLVTGATGFIGTHTLNALRGHDLEVHALSREGGAAVSYERRSVKWHKADLFDAPSTRRVVRAVRPTHLLHLAWITTPGEYLSSPLNQDWVEASLDLAQVFTAAGGRRIVAAGTCAEYDWSLGWCDEETTPLRPTSVYGQAKLELYHALAALSIRTGVELAWGRVFFPFGPGEHPLRLIPSVCRNLLAGRWATCSFGFHSRDFVAVEDVASAMVALLRSDAHGPLNIGSGRPVPVRDLVLELADRLRASNRLAFGAVATPDESVPLVAASTTRLRRALGWSPTVTLDDALARTIDYWREEMVRDMAAG